MNTAERPIRKQGQAVKIQIYGGNQPEATYVSGMGLIDDTDRPMLFSLLNLGFSNIAGLTPSDCPTAFQRKKLKWEK